MVSLSRWAHSHNLIRFADVPGNRLSVLGRGSKVRHAIDAIPGEGTWQGGGRFFFRGYAASAAGWSVSEAELVFPKLPNTLGEIRLGGIGP